MRPERLFLGAALALVPGCTSWTWNRRYLDERPDAAAAARLEVGRSDLADCLAELGAPTLVEEVGPGMALYWIWLYQRDWGFTAEVPVGDDSLSFTYTEDARHLSALQILLDQELELVDMHEGRLGNLRERARARPQVPEQDR